MKAVVLKEPGSVENLEVREIETPTATPGHVVVKVHACGVRKWARWLQSNVPSNN